MRLLRSRFAGPFGIVIDALESELRRGAAEDRDKARPGVVCGSCGTSNRSGAKFCYECGTKLSIDA
jgi:hypothetical protein